MNAQTVQLMINSGAIAANANLRPVSITTGVRGWLRQIADRIRWHRQRIGAIRELRRLSNWQLQDLGIDRSQIPGIVDGLMTDR